MNFTRTVIVTVTMLALSACASNPPRPVKSQFEDIPVAKGMNYVAGDSMAIETPTVQAAREVYRGRIELESLSSATRATLQANGWRHVSTTKTAQHGISQVYEKGGTSLQVLLWEGLYFTYAEYTTARVLQAPK